LARAARGIRSGRTWSRWNAGAQRVHRWASRRRRARAVASARVREAVAAIRRSAEV